MRSAAANNEKRSRNPSAKVAEVAEMGGGVLGLLVVRAVRAPLLCGGGGRRALLLERCVSKRWAEGRIAALRSRSTRDADRLGPINAPPAMAASREMSLHSNVEHARCRRLLHKPGGADGVDFGPEPVVCIVPACGQPAVGGQAAARVRCGVEVKAKSAGTARCTRRRGTYEL